MERPRVAREESPSEHRGCECFPRGSAAGLRRALQQGSGCCLRPRLREAPCGSDIPTAPPRAAGWCLTELLLGRGLGLVTLEVSSNLGAPVNPSLLCCLFLWLCCLFPPQSSLLHSFCYLELGLFLGEFFPFPPAVTNCLCLFSAVPSFHTCSSMGLLAQHSV